MSIQVDELEQSKSVRYHISRDGTQVLAWCTDAVPFPNLVFIDALTNIKSSLYCHEGLVRHAVFGRESARIISCGNDGKVVVWDSTALEPLMSLVGHDGVVLCCCINHDGTHIVSSGEDCTVRVKPCNSCPPCDLSWVAFLPVLWARGQPYNSYPCSLSQASLPVKRRVLSFPPHPGNTPRPPANVPPLGAPVEC